MEKTPGPLMERLLRERERFENDEEFRKFALETVRHFIAELRSLDIELTLRPNHYDSGSLSDARRSRTSNMAQ
jgi:hypothetical protein